MNFKNISLKELNELSKETLMEQLGIEYLEVKDHFVRAKMPVNHQTKQPMGILHGGATIALAETIASLGSAYLTDLNAFDIRGSSVSANHLGAATDGFVYGEARLTHHGRISHVWDVEVNTEQGKKISVIRVTVIIIPKKKA